MIIKKILDFFNKGHQRTVTIKKNIIGTFVLKAYTVLISFLLVPLSISCLDAQRYGLWLTINSIIGWFAIFDIGLGHGLRNKFAENKAKGKIKIIKVYTSTAYFSITIICFLLFLMFMVVNNFLNWQKILNTSLISKEELNILIIFIFLFFFIRLITQLICSVLLADQKTFLSSLVNSIGSTFVLISLFIMYYFDKSSVTLLTFGIISSLMPVIVFIAANIFFFRTSYLQYIPSLKYVKLKYVKDLLGLGSKFFLLQVNFIIIFSTGNFIINYFAGSENVTVYNLAYTYMSIISFIILTINTPFWSGFTDAYFKKEFNWIRKSIKQLNILWLAMCGFTIIMIVFSKLFFKIWIGDKVLIPNSTVILTGIYFMVYTFRSSYGFFLNGIGKLAIQIYISSFLAVFNIIIAVIFVKYLNWGVNGMIFSMILTSIPYNIFTYVQYYKVINLKATGIWNR